VTEGKRKERVVPQLPPVGRRIRLLIDSDAACEVDDQYAIALALLSPERFEIEGFVGTHFGDSGGPEGPAKSAAEIQRVLEAAGQAGRFPVKHGSDPLIYSKRPQPSEGVDFIIERALAGQKDNPLWIVGLGAATNIASAYLAEPKIAERVIVLWHGRTQWPLRCWNFNAVNDLKAVRVLFASALPLALFDTGTYLRCPMAQSEQNILPHGPLGRYLHEIRLRSPGHQHPDKGLFDLGDVASLVDPSLVEWEIAKAPRVDWDTSYDWKHDFGKILRIYQISRDRTFELLFRKLAEAR